MKSENRNIHGTSATGYPRERNRWRRLKYFYIGETSMKENRLDRKVSINHQIININEKWKWRRPLTSNVEEIGVAIEKAHSEIEIDNRRRSIERKEENFTIEEEREAWNRFGAASNREAHLPRVVKISANSIGAGPSAWPPASKLERNRSWSEENLYQSERNNEMKNGIWRRK